MDNLIRDAVAGDVAVLEANTAKAEALNLEAELAQVENRLTAAEEIIENPPPSPILLYVALALAVGLLIGGGIILATSTRVPSDQDEYRPN